MWEIIVLGSIGLVMAILAIVFAHLYISAKRMADDGDQSEQVMKRRGFWKISVLFLLLSVALATLMAWNMFWAKVLGVAVLAGGLVWAFRFVNKRIANLEECLRDLHLPSHPYSDSDIRRTWKKALRSWKIVRGVICYIDCPFLLVLAYDFFF